VCVCVCVCARARARACVCILLHDCGVFVSNVQCVRERVPQCVYRYIDR
jgi:hypothetical protein